MISNRTAARRAASAWRVGLRWKLAPERAALLVRDDPLPFALVGRWAGGGAVIGGAPIRTAAPSDDPFALLDDQPRIDGREAANVGGGWFGWLGYQLGARLEPIGPSPPAPVGGGPAFQLAYYDNVLRLDQAGRWWFEAIWSEDRANALLARLAELESRACDPPRPRPVSTEPWRITPASTGHALAVAACRERIRAGDLFQANICARLESRISGEPIDLFATALQRLRPDRAAFIGGDTGAVVSLSPELFLERHGRRVRSAPIKGTRAKHGDPAMAVRARAELLGSDKDRAENVMIVDLVRNDLGRVCEAGSVHVEALAQARPRAGVWHLVSEVAGTVREGVGDADVVRAAFPPGSVTGAPKIAAMNVIAELESTARELYTGAIGFASPLAGLELSVAIRTFEVRGERIWLGVGGGIVADSDPAAEAAECMIKAAPLLEAIGASLTGSSPASDPPGPAATGPAATGHAPPAPLRLSPRPIPRPDPRLGVFETLLVLERRPVALEPHLGRLADSVAALYHAELPPGLAQELRAAAWPHQTGRLRVDVCAGSDGVRAEITVSPRSDRRVPVRLCPVSLPGGLGMHKWIDRRLLGALADAVDGEPLLCDLDGHVLEAQRANIFIVEGGGWIVTPPADGRILPGVTRASVIDLARSLGLEVGEQPIDRRRLARAGEIFVTGSIGGVEPALLSGAPATPAGPVTARLAAAWRARSQLARPGAARLSA